VDSTNVSQQRQVRFSDHLPTGESRKAIGMFLRSAKKGGDPVDITGRVEAWVQADWAKAHQTGDLAEMDRLQRLQSALRDHHNSAVNLAAWALKAQEAPA
jgi:hypothetical protein